MANDNIPGAPEIGANTTTSEKDPIKKSPSEQTDNEITDPTSEFGTPQPLQNAPPKKDFTPPPKPRSKKLWLIGGFLILLAVAAVAWLMMGKKVSSPGTNTSSTVSKQAVATANTYTPTAVVYAHKADDNSPYVLYARPAGGGDKIAADLKLGTSETINSRDVKGSNVVFATNKAIYISTDAGKTYKTILSLDINEQITSVRLSTDGQTVVFGYLSTAGGKNVVKTIDLAGKKGKTLFTSTQAGVILTGYNSIKQKIIYEESCWNCDGFSGLPTLRDLKTDKTTELTNITRAFELTGEAVNNDFTTYLYAKATANADAPSEFMGQFAGAPYDIYSVDLATYKATKLTTFGVKGEKSPNGTLKLREVVVGFVIGSNTPYYTNDAQIYEVKAGISNLVYEATKPVLFLPFVGSETILTGTGSQTSDYSFDNYNITSKKSTNIFSGNDNTIIFGVTTK